MSHAIVAPAFRRVFPPPGRPRVTKRFRTPGAPGVRSPAVPEVELVPVDEPVLAQLLQAALTRAAPDEVTPPLGEPGTWNAERIAWMAALHRDRRPGLDGPLGEATWAVRAGGEIVGAVRLKRTDSPGCLETGIWLASDVRGAGVGLAAVAAVLGKAATAGAVAVRAETAAANAPALAVLRRLGFALAEPDAAGRVAARRELRPAP